MDLGIHLVDLAPGLLDAPRVERVASSLSQKGRKLRAAMPWRITARLFSSCRPAAPCSSPVVVLAGRPRCLIEASFYGTRGGHRFPSDGSFYDFRAELFRGTSREVLVDPPDAWVAAPRWSGPHGWLQGSGSTHIGRGAGAVAATIDRIYAGG